MTLIKGHDEKTRLKRVIPKFNPFLVSPYLVPLMMLAKKFFWNRDNKGWIEIEGTKMSILDKEAKITQEFNIYELEDFKVHFVDNPILENAEPKDFEELKKRLSRITFSYDKINYELFYKARKKVLIKVFNHWYEEGVKFKEYYNLRRVYLGRQPTYSDIQVLKKLHNFEW